MWADRAHWNRFRRCLESHGFPTHAVTLLAHEAPQDMGKLRDIGIMDYVSQIREEVAKLSDAPFLVGHSMGALVAQKVAEAESVRGLVLLGPIAPAGISPITPSVALCAGGSLLDALRGRPFIIPRWNACFGLMNTLTRREQAVVYESFLSESGKALSQMLRGAIAVDERAVTCPVLVGVGAMDRATPPSVARRIARKYGAEYREYPGECHFLSLAREVMDDVAAWIREQVQE
jgi:pimeloyl-ACP methyl ester carboxylesterase